MTCKRCGSNDLWDDNMTWGCNGCGYMEVNGQPSFILAKDKPGLARSTDEMRERGQLRPRYSEGYDDEHR